jgi:hypothetical protein
MEYLAYTEKQIRTLKALLDMTEISGIENCKRIIMMFQILEENKKVNVEEVKDGKENL